MAALSEEALPSWEEPETKPRKKRAANEERFKGPPVEQVFLDVPEEGAYLRCLRHLMETIGTEFVRRELKFIPAKVKVIEYYSVNYGCPKCRKGGCPPSIKRGRVAGRIESMGWRVHLPWHGLCTRNISTACPCTGRNWIGNSAVQTSAEQPSPTGSSRMHRIFHPMYAYFRKKLLARSFAMADETPVQVLHEPGRRAQTQSYMWLFRSGEDEGPPIILYKYAPTRAGDNAVEFLEGYSGYLMCDGYSGYNKVPDAKRTACWAHIRRYLIDAIPKGKQPDYTQPSVQGSHVCQPSL